jgi:hypothetical protein
MLMAKKRAVRKNSKAWRAYKKQQKQAIVVVIGLFILASALFFINSKAAEQKTVDDLGVKTSSDIRKIAQAMTTKVGNPILQRHDLSGQHYYLVYGVSSEGQASGVRAGLTTGSRSQPELWESKNQVALAPFHSLGTDFKEQVSSEEFTDKKTGASCRIVYIFYPSAYELNNYPRFDIQSSGILLVDISC